MGNATIVLVLGLGLNIGLLSYHLLSRTGDSVENTAEYYETTVARNIANAAMDLTLQQLRINASWREGFAGVPFADGMMSATLSDTVSGGVNYVRITVTGEYNGKSNTIIVLVRPIAFLPAAVRGGVTANSDVRTLGSLVVDGRDHTIGGSLIPNSGTLGISAVGSYSQAGNSKIGGTVGGTDVSPSRPADPGTTEENAGWGSSGFPETPDEVMGGEANRFPEGSLKAIAMSGLNGGQYVTNPAGLSFPLSGVTYVELPSGGEWSTIDFAGVSSGIIVVHNSAGNARMRNIDSGTFTGLIIADDIEHVHATIIGAVVSLIDNPAGNCLGNGSGEVLYSSEAIRQATESAAEGSIYSIVSYWE